MNDVLYKTEFIYFLSKSVVTIWKRLGHLLSVSDSELDVINFNEEDDVEKAYQMLCTWRNQQPFPQLKDVTNALDKEGRTDLIKQIEGYASINTLKFVAINLIII